MTEQQPYPQGISKPTKLVITGLLGVIVGVAAVGLHATFDKFSNSTKSDSKRVWVQYEGYYDDYKVRIDDEIQDSNHRRLVHLDAIDKDKVPYGVTGHDYDGDDNLNYNMWESIFIRETSSNGYNEAIFNESGTWTYDPCPADKGRVPRFTYEQIRQAKSMLQRAMTEVYNKDHIKHKQVLLRRD